MVEEKNAKIMNNIGYGTWRLEGKDAEEAVYNALSLGYRHIDCASIYGNEKDVGKGIKKYLDENKDGVKREDLWITSKLWNSDHQVENVEKAAKHTLKDLGLEYLDLYLIHFPVAMEHTGIGSPGIDMDWMNMVCKFDYSVSLNDTWKAMEKLVQAKLVKNIGVANFKISDLKNIMSSGVKIKPYCNQFECHPYMQLSSLMKFCNINGIKLVAHSPLGGGKANKEAFGAVPPIDNEDVSKIAKELKCTSAQVCLQFNLQRGVAVIPKSSKKERMTENIESGNVKLAKEHISTLEKLDKKGAGRCFNVQAMWGFDLFD